MTLSTLCDIKLHNDALRGMFLRAGLTAQARHSEATEEKPFALFLSYKSADERHIWPPVAQGST